MVAKQITEGSFLSKKEKIFRTSFKYYLFANLLFCSAMISLSLDNPPTLILHAISLISFAALYFFAYKKCGTKLLTFLIASTLSLLFQTTRSLAEESVTLLTVFLIYHAIFLSFALLMQSINKKILNNNYVNSDTYQKIVSAFKGAHSLEELKGIYRKAKRKCPRHSRQDLKYEYEEFEEKLSQPQSV